MLLLALAACSPEAPAPAEEVRFVREGLLRGGVFEPRAWTPGETVEGQVAPLQAECVPTFQVELEDMDRLAAMGAPGPAAALAFSPDGQRLAIGSDAGSLRVVDAAGKTLVERRLAEGAVKQVAWSADGGTLYVGAQSPDAELEALDPDTLQARWTVRLSEELETSALPPADDVYGLYSLPAVFAIRVLPDGSLLVAGSHGWTPADGVRRNRGRLYRYAADGTRLGAWPPEGPADAVLLHPAVAGMRAIVGVSRSADGPPPAGLPIGGVAALDLTTMTTTWTRTFPVLAPYFREVFLWEAIGLGDGVAFAGLGDGRAFLMDPATGDVRVALTRGVPILTSGIPIATGVGFGAAVGDDVAFTTTATNIPWGSADPMTRPPSAHPAQDTVHLVGADGSARWSRQGMHAVQGVAPSPDGRWLAVTAGERATDERTDAFGALVLDRTDGELRAMCATEGPAYFRAVWAPDGRLAVVETAFSVGSEVRGAYRVTVFR